MPQIVACHKLIPFLGRIWMCPVQMIIPPKDSVLAQINIFQYTVTNSLNEIVYHLHS